ncbi:stage III sporulation protein AA [Petroclostridium sp. X23]|uniref:stage III sporulation protein AA n=1 Tax=Petroclostridium sp. X23 TaxID=3045146 RepID=UPI0024AD8821|nr:stage III sporulation protein AA [Petroclostridium sp. X23]WHH59646.1 stage III sporulation protein AA [Petroclostridium sp. X23]
MIITNEKVKSIGSLKSYAQRSTKDIIYNDILLCVSTEVRNIIRKIPGYVLEPVEEIRLRANKPLMLYDHTIGWFVTPEGKFSEDESSSYLVSQDDINNSLELMSNNSIYSIQEELRNGFITVSGGHRVGITGKVIANGQKVSHIKDISAMNIRISKQIIGAADHMIKHIIKRPNIVHNTLIISPPQCGKTTMLRDIARQLSYGINDCNFQGIKVGIVDERSEIAGCYKGIPQNDVGPRTDVLDACPKACGLIMMIRSMSPAVIITDEIGMEEDIAALKQVLNAGVKIITSIHGYSRQDVLRRPLIGKLIGDNIFEKIIILSKSRGTGTIEEIIDGKSRDVI